MKKLSFFAFVASLLISNNLFSQTIINEDFKGDELPAGWSIQSKEIGTKTWMFQPDYDDVEVYESKTATQDEWLITPSIDLSTSESVTLNFELWLFGKNSFLTSNSCDVKIKVSSDNGATWTEIWNDNQISETDFTGDYSYGKKRTASLSAFCGEGMNNVKVGFQFTSTGAGASSTAFAAMINVDISAELLYNVTAGGLAALLPQSVRGTLTCLALTGTIDARDFKTMRDSLPLLSHINLSGANIVDYTGTEGTGGITSTLYPANEIPQYAFCTKSEVGKTSLISIFLPSSVSSIATYAFKNCFNLSTIPFPNSLTLIGDRSFWNCFNITSLTIPKSVTKIGRTAFNNCVNLSSVTFEAPSSLTEIGIWAFGYCTKLRWLTIPSTVNTIGEVAFSKSVTSVMVDPGNPNYSSLDGALFNKDKSALLYCPLTSIGTYIIPSTVKTVGVDAFYSCSHLTSVTMPSGLTTLENWAFEECTGLITLSLPESLNSIGNQAFYNCTGLTSIKAFNPVPVDLSFKTDVFFGIDKSTCTLFVPAGTKNLYAEAPQWQDFQNIIEMMPVEMTYIPDDNFEQALINLGYDSGPLNDSVPTANISSVSTLNVAQKNIADLTGIEAFSNLQTLQCYSNKLTQLNVSGNVSLLNLVCDDNLLTNIDVTNNSELISLSFSRNYSMTSIDVSKNQKLNTLWCDNSKIDSLNLSNNPLLVTLYCNKTLLSNLDISKNLKIFDLNATGNPNLFCIQVYDQAIAETKKSWQKDAQASYSTDCAGLMSKVTYVPDDNFEQALIDLGYDSGPLNDSVPTFNISGITNLNISNKYISDLTGIEDFSALKSLDCSYNQLSKLDFGYNLNLTTLYCNNNKLISLNLENGHTSNFFQYYKTFDSRNNPQLFCIQVDDPTIFAGYPGVFKDSFSSYSNDCSALPMTYVPDDNFEQALIGLGYDSGPLNDSVQTSIIVTVTSLSLQDKNIADLTGIEDFSSLERLYLSGNKLTSLDLSQNTKLKVLHCQNNQLTSLDISKNTALTHLAPNFNQLKTLDLSNNPGLIQVFCQSNQLTELDVSNNKSLITVICGSNQLTDLNVSNNSALVYLACENNKIENLDLSNNHSLINLTCNKNNLYKINLQNGNNANMIGTNKGLNATENPNLLCIQVDNPELAATYTNWLKDPQTSYSNFCNVAPFASAGPDQIANENTVVTLDGSASFDMDGDSILFQWDGPQEIVLNSFSAVNPEFTAPEVKNDTTFIFTLTVNDGKINSSADTVYITIKQVNKAPVANAGANIRIDELISFTLSGSKSSDPDNDKLSFRWIMPTQLATDSKTSEKISVTAPEVKTDTTFTVYLIVNDGITDSESDKLLITVVNVNKQPVAFAGNDIVAAENTTVMLNGDNSYDLDEDQLEYEWIAPAGIELSSTNIANPTFVAPNVTSDSALTFILSVFDGLVYSMPDSVTVTIKKENQIPVADAGGDITADENTSIQLDGTGSFDSDNDALLFNWAAPVGIILNAETSINPTFTAPKVSKDTTYLITLTVSDGLSNSLVDSVYIFVKNINQAPMANAGENREVIANSVVNFDGSLSYDPDGDTLSFQWSAPAGIELNTGNSSKCSATMPDVSEPTEFVFGLIVSDGYLLSEKKSIIITVVPQTAEVTLSAKLNGVTVPPSSVKYDFYLKNDGVFEWQNLSKVNAGASSKFNLTKGNWIVLASPVAGGTHFAPTYFGDKLNWGDATPIEITDYNPISAVINCIPVDTITESGEFTIEGVITETTGTKSGVYFNATKEGTPVSGVVVNLYQETKLVPAAFAVTDGNGYYAFNHIPKGKYFITVELPGFEPEEEFKIELENESPAVAEMNFTVVTESGIITDVTTAYNRLLFYPNPFNNEIKIAGQIDIEKLIIRNITGQSVITVSHPESSVATEFLNPGIYFITAYDKNNCILSTNKLVKNR